MVRPEKPIRIKASDLKRIRKELILEQGNKCPLCERDLSMVQPKQRCVDHNHDLTGPAAGAVRGVLCSNCNGNEGRIRTRAICAKGHLTEVQWLRNLVEYLEKHSTNQTGYIHHTWKTQEERRIIKNLKARDYRAKKKGL
jgi:hypothetical protein